MKRREFMAAMAGAAGLAAPVMPMKPFSVGKATASTAVSAKLYEVFIDEDALKKSGLRVVGERVLADHQRTR